MRLASSRAGLGDQPSPPTNEESTRIRRWLRIWVALLAAVTLVVAVFLLLISNSLAEINGRLATADRAITGTGANTATLPAQLERLNATLAAIDPALRPIPTQGGEIISALRSVARSLASADSALGGASSALTGTLDRFRSLGEVLVDFDDPPDQLGVHNAHRRLAILNGVGSPRQASEVGDGARGQHSENPHSLAAVEADTANILAGLGAVNSHLASVCNSPAVRLLAGPGRC